MESSKDNATKIRNICFFLCVSGRINMEAFKKAAKRIDTNAIFVKGQATAIRSLEAYNEKCLANIERSDYYIE
jgi:hypothetical protein